MTVGSSPFHNSQRKKRLGQYFTGLNLARLLAELANARRARTVLDPMCGTGDMLAACFELGSKQTMAGIEIDPLAFDLSSERLGGAATLIRGNAFSMDSLRQLPGESFDLVITNPPYVRYQQLSSKTPNELDIPDGSEVRDGLVAAIDQFGELDDEDRRLLKVLARSYSGLSDLAVPAWLLCALLTRVGGTLAMVVPESWLNRDYAHAIQYLLLRWFRIRFVVEDAHAVWFDDALVRTTLLVAERVHRRNSAWDWTNEAYPHVRVSKDALGPRSIVEHMFPGEASPEAAFASFLTQEEPPQAGKNAFAVVETVTLRQKAANLRRAMSRSKWLKDLEQSEVTVGDSEGLSDDSMIHIPPAIEALLNDGAEANFETLSTLGVDVGQGLRTGANSFFYVDVVGEAEGELLISPDSSFGMAPFIVPPDCVRPVLRKQSELDNGYALSDSSLSGRCLVLQRRALPEDLARVTPTLRASTGYLEIPSELADFIRKVAKTNVGTAEMPKFIPEMSAVRTNVRSVEAATPAMPPKFWYQLPAFAPRHLPELFIPRVNSGHPRTRLNLSLPALIDANFSTLKVRETSSVTPYALLAILNSSWCVLLMEESATVMGGGALKLEATHLRRLPMPALNPSAWKLLTSLGEKLASSPNEPAAVLRQIDLIVCDGVAGGKNSEELLAAIESLKVSRIKKRQR